MTFVLAPENLHWIPGTTDPAEDLCVHGSVRFRIGDDVLADETKDCTVSAAALYLLRTLEEPFGGDPRRGEALFPCCGFTMLDVDAPDVVIVGCMNGDHVAVTPGPDVVRLGSGERTWEVPAVAWREAVFAFADAVDAFYRSSAPKRPSGEDVAGFRRFREEWKRRRHGTRAARDDAR